MNMAIFLKKKINYLAENNIHFFLQNYNFLILGIDFRKSCVILFVVMKMFEKISIIKFSDCNAISVENPDTVKITINCKDFYYTLNKESRNIFYSFLNLTYKQSKNLYDIDLEFWHSNLHIEKINDYKNENYVFILNKELNLIIGIYQDCEYEEKLKIFQSLESKSITVKMYERIILSAVNDIKILFELNYDTCSYFIYIERYIKDKNIYIPAFSCKPLFESNSFQELFEFDILDEIETIKLLNDNISEFDFDSAKFSLREIYESFEKTKLSVNLNGRGKIKDFKGVSNGIVLINYFGNIKYAFKTIKTLTPLKRSVVFEDISINDLLKFYSYLYNNSTEIKISIECINCLFSALENLDYDTFYLKEF